MEYHKMRWFLALSGGAAKGAFQVPIRSRLFNAYGEPVGQMGTSVGACNVGLPPDRLEKLWENIDSTKDFQKLRIFSPWKGLYDLAPLRKLHDESNSLRSPIPTWAGVYDAAAQEHLMIRLDRGGSLSLSDARDVAVASAAIPIIHRQIWVKGRLLSDGGVWSVTGRLPPAVSAKSLDAVVVVWCQPPTSERRKRPKSWAETDNLWDSVEAVYDAWQDKVAESDLEYWQRMARKVPIYMFFPETWEEMGKSFDASEETREKRFQLGRSAEPYRLYPNGRLVKTDIKW